jgi:hypothetical protein
VDRSTVTAAQGGVARGASVGGRWRVACTSATADRAKQTAVSLRRLVVGSVRLWLGGAEDRGMMLIERGG